MNSAANFTRAEPKPSPVPRLQRKCACGHGQTFPSHTCEPAALAQSKPSASQAPAIGAANATTAARDLLTIGAPDDVLEREADRIAHQVMIGAATTTSSIPTSGEQRLPATPSNLIRAQAKRKSSIRSGGRPSTKADGTAACRPTCQNRESHWQECLAEPSAMLQTSSNLLRRMHRNVFWFMEQQFPRGP